MRSIAILMIILLAGCEDFKMASTGALKGKLADFELTSEEKNLVLEGWNLRINGEDLGLLKFDNKSTGSVTNRTQQFEPLKTKYGTFDAVGESSFDGSRSLTVVRITLDGEYVATVSGPI